jgi:hypothetical protein
VIERESATGVRDDDRRWTHLPIAHGAELDRSTPRPVPRQHDANARETR